MKRGHYKFWFMLALLGFSSASWAWKMEAGVATLKNTFDDATFTSITFQQTYDVTPLVFMLPSDQGGDPTDIRVRNILTTGFEAAQVEPTGNDGPHVGMTVYYIAIEPGSYMLPDGTRIQAGAVDTSERQRGFEAPFPFPFPQLPNKGWKSIQFSPSFNSTPAVVAQIQTMNNELGAPPGPPDDPSVPWLTTAVDDVDANGFNAALERSDSDTGSVDTDETYAWLAIEPGPVRNFDDNNGNNVSFTAAIGGSLGGWDGANRNLTVNYADLGSGAQPVIGASLNTHNDDDGGWVRYRRNTVKKNKVGLRGDEDRDRDPGDRSKSNGQFNDVGVIAFSRPFNASFGDPDLLFMKRIDQVVSDPVNGTNGPSSNPKAIPLSVIQYVMSVSNHGDGVADNVVISDKVPDNATLFVGDINGANSGPIRILNNSSGLGYSYTPLTPTMDDLEFSSNNGSTWDAPAGPDDFNPAITHFRVNFSGVFAANPGGTAPKFDLYFRVRVD